MTTALVAAASGNVSASNTQFVQNLVVNYVQQQGAAYIGKLVVDGVIKEGSPEHAALHAIVACGGAAASGQSCGAGAAGAAASSLLTNLFGDTNPNETDIEREAKRNLVASLVTGIASLEGGDAVAANQGAIAALDNNWLATQQIVQANKELAEAKTPLEQLQVIGKWSGTSVKQDLLTGGGIVEGLRDAGLDTLQGLGPFLADPMKGVNGLRELINNPEARAQMGEAVYAELITKINRIDNALATGGDGNAIQLGRDLGDLIFQAGTVITGVGGLAKGGVELANLGINVTTKTLEKMALNLPNVAPGAIHGFETADSLNALMKANEWSPAWKSGTKVADVTLKAGDKVRMVVDKATYEALTTPGADSSRALGGWATFDDVKSASYARNELAITSEMKTDVSYVIEVELTRPVNAKVGIVGPQGGAAGGGNQIHFVAMPEDRSSIFRYVPNSGRALP